MGRKRIGIVGGGQLGRMMAMESGELDIEVFVLDPTPECPASEYATQVVGDFKDKETVLQFAKDIDVLTFEIESANAEALQELQAAGVTVHPSPQTLSIIRDKFRQKEFLQENDIPVAPFAEVADAVEVTAFAAEYGYPVVLKSRFGAYDGRGNRTIENEGQIPEALEALGEDLYVEAWVPFLKELAVVVARGQDGTIETYPVVETIHTDHICDEVYVPADIDEKMAASAQALAARIMDVFHGAGVFGIEMFLTKDGKVLTNEIAPRVHNSGHFTLGGCNVSQFAQHMHAVCGLPLITPEMVKPFAVMKNILGERTGPVEAKGIEEAKALGAFVEIYGKHDTKIKRKMGHVTAIADSREEATRLAKESHRNISI